MTNKFSMPFAVSLSDAGPGGPIKIPVLFNCFQDAAGAHANSIGFGGADILRKGYSWVITRYRLSVTRFPVLFDRFQVTTWRSGEEGNYAIREFSVTDENGNILLQATSSWMLLNIFKREPVRPSELFPGYPVNPERALYDSFTSVPEIAEAQSEKDFTVRRSDLDMNNHVNNSIYTSWIHEMGEDLNEGKTLKDIIMNFRGEARYKQTVTAQALNDLENGRVIHKLICKETGKEITRGITEWM